MNQIKTRHPRCFFVHALAPESLSAAQANRDFNAFVANRDLPLALFHDHFIGRAGGVALFYIASPAERDALLEQEQLRDWQVEIHPLIFSRSPAAFDEQIAFTLKAYRDQNWDQLQMEDRPSYGDPHQEAESASELED